MNKITLRLTSPDLWSLIGFLEFSLENAKEFGYTKSHEDKLILASLAELLIKFLSVNKCYKKAYKMQINVSHGLALLVHCRKNVCFVASIDTIIINDIIGIVDKKTA